MLILSKEYWRFSWFRAFSRRNSDIYWNVGSKTDLPSFDNLVLSYVSSSFFFSQPAFVFFFFFLHLIEHSLLRPSFLLAFVFFFFLHLIEHGLLRPSIFLFFLFLFLLFSHLLEPWILGPSGPPLYLEPGPGSFASTGILALKILGRDGSAGAPKGLQLN